jgi:hypothetical protein
LYDGRAVRVLMSCRIEREQGADGPLLVITGTPAGVGSDGVLQELESGVHQARRVRPIRRYAEFDPDWVDPRRPPETVVNVRDQTTRAGTRIVLEVADDAGLDEAERWLHGLWPVTVEADWQIPGGLAASLQSWAERCRVDPSGLDALCDMGHWSQPAHRGGQARTLGE